MTITEHPLAEPTVARAKVTKSLTRVEEARALRSFCVGVILKELDAAGGDGVVGGELYKAVREALIRELGADIYSWPLFENHVGYLVFKSTVSIDGQIVRSAA